MAAWRILHYLTARGQWPGTVAKSDLDTLCVWSTRSLSDSLHQHYTWSPTCFSSQPCICISDNTFQKHTTHFKTDFQTVSHFCSLLFRVWISVSESRVRESRQWQKDFSGKVNIVVLYLYFIAMKESRLEPQPCGWITHSTSSQCSSSWVMDTSTELTQGTRTEPDRKQPSELTTQPSLRLHTVTCERHQKRLRWGAVAAIFATHWVLRSHSTRRFPSSSWPPPELPWSAPAQCCSHRRAGPLWRPDSAPPLCCSVAPRSSWRRGVQDKWVRQMNRRTATGRRRKRGLRGGIVQAEMEGITKEVRVKVKARPSVKQGVRQEVCWKWPRR